MNGRSVRGVEAYTRWSLILVPVLGEPVLLALLLRSFSDGDPDIDGRGALVVGVLLVAHVAVSIRTMDSALRRIDPHRGFRGLVPLALSTVALIAAVVVVFPVDGPTSPIFASIPRASAISVISMTTLVALTTRWGMRVLMLGVLIALGLIAWAQAGSGQMVLAAVVPAYALSLVAIVASFRLTVWILEVVRELEVSRESHASLAVAEERLRIARDIHDVVGRALSVVAVKSELAANFARRQDERAEAEMLAVHQVAQESMAQVRLLVSGYRPTDLGAELAGARAVLDSTGIEVTVTGSADGAQPGVQDVLGAVVRESVTNMVRHSRATWCTLALSAPRQGVPAWRLTVRNDGASPETGAPGHGLRGLTERLAPLGGNLDTTEADGVFTLTASVPAKEDM